MYKYPILSLDLTSDVTGNPPVISTFESKMSIPFSVQTSSTTTDGDFAMKLSPGSTKMMGTSGGLLNTIVSSLFRSTDRE